MKPYLEITDSSLASMEAFAEQNVGPIVMVNLMQVRPKAVYAASLVDNCSGYEALARYTNDSATVRQAAGAELVWSGQIWSEGRSWVSQARRREDLSHSNRWVCTGKPI